MQWDRSNSGFKFLNGGPTCSADNYHVKPGAGASAGAGAGGGRGSHSMADEGQENGRRNHSMRRGSGGGGGGGSKGCPGTLKACIAACPSEVKVFEVCTANCGERCGKK